MSIEIRLAVTRYDSAVAYCVCQAFIHYLPHIGKQPGLMLDDYQSLKDQSVVYANSGYVEFDQRVINGCERIFYSKAIVMRANINLIYS
jgi:hypothetical protein